MKLHLLASFELADGPVDRQGSHPCPLWNPDRFGELSLRGKQKNRRAGNRTKKLGKEDLGNFLDELRKLVRQALVENRDEKGHAFKKTLDIRVGGGLPEHRSDGRMGRGKLLGQQSQIGKLLLIGARGHRTETPIAAILKSSGQDNLSVGFDQDRKLNRHVLTVDKNFA